MSWLFISLNHPLALGIALICQTTLICFISRILSYSPWFAYILWIIFLGATLVLFIYVTSLASNETFKLSSLFPLPIIIIIIITPFILLIDSILFPIKYMSRSMYSYYSLSSANPIIRISIIYNINSFTTIFIILYLLLTLLIVVKISRTFLGPLRSSS